MSKVTNQLFIKENHVEIIVEKTGDFSYKNVVLIDLEDIHKIGKIRISNSGYAYLSNGKSVAHVIMGHISNLETVVDHINHNPLDNRKSNLRIVSQLENQTNKSSSRNNTGVVGISLRCNGKYTYYRATVSLLGNLVEDRLGRNVSKKISKQFNINKYGKEKAFELACKWLHDKRKELGYLKY